MAIVTTDNQHYKNIADAIRGTGSYEGPISPAQMAKCITEIGQNAHQAGVQSEYDRFWDAFQQNGTLANYRYAFSQERWTDVNFKPKYDIKPSGSNSMTHFMTNSRITDVVAILNECGVKLDTSGAAGNASTWFSGTVTRLPAISLENVNTLANTFGWCGNLHTIEKVILREDGGNTFDGMFVSCGSLTNLTIEGKIGQNGFSVSGSKLLTHDSLMSILNALQEKTGDASASWVVTLGTANLNKLTDAEKAIATQKGWTLA